MYYKVGFFSHGRLSVSYLWLRCILRVTSVQLFDAAGYWNSAV